MNGKKILVAYDGSPDSEKALKLAAVLARALFARIELVSVLDLSPVLSDDTGNIGTGHEAFIRECEYTLDMGRQRLEELGIVVSTVVLEGNPAEMLIQHAQKIKASMIVAGTRGLGGFKRLLLGSTAQALVMYSDIPVVIAK